MNADTETAATPDLNDPCDAPRDAPRSLSFREARLEQLRYWAGKSIAERLNAAATLTRDCYRWRGVDLDQSETDFTLSRTSRRKS